MTSFIDEFHKLYHDSKIWSKNKWLDIPCYKLPFDMVVFQELIVKQRPDIIIETGTAYGGSAAFYASICELIGNGNIITIDVESRIQTDKIKKYNWSDRINFILGSSTNQITIKKVDKIVDRCTNCMVILDSWHEEEFVYNEMKLYSKYVPVNGYMIVEDTHIGNPIEWKYYDKGPGAAVKRFLKENKDEWEVDYECEKSLISFCPGGFLRRIK